MNKFITLTILMASSASVAKADAITDFYNFDAEIEYRALIPDANADSRNFTVGKLHFDLGYDENPSYYTGFDFEYGIDNNEAKAGMYALHFGRDSKNFSFGILAGQSFDRIEANFYGVEGAAYWRKLSLQTRYTIWDIDGADQTSWKLDGKITYAFNDKWSVFYDHGHMETANADYKGDEFLAGVTYNHQSGLSLSLSGGYVHPKSYEEATGDQDLSEVWSQVGFNVNYNLGRNTRRLDPVSIPDFISYQS